MPATVLTFAVLYAVLSAAVNTPGPFASVLVRVPLVTARFAESGALSSVVSTRKPASFPGSFVDLLESPALPTASFAFVTASVAASAVLFPSVPPYVSGFSASSSRISSTLSRLTPPSTTSMVTASASVSAADRTSAPRGTAIARK